MKKLEFKISIDASRKKVWETMLNPDTYKKWVNVSWPGSTYEGNWKQGEEIRFVSTSGEGTLAKLVEYRPYEFLLANHIAVINKDGTTDSESEMAKSWIGTTESYAFSEKNGVTALTVEINCPPAWASMFDEGWPNALQALKDLSESKVVAG